MIMIETVENSNWKISTLYKLKMWNQRRKKGIYTIILEFDNLYIIRDIIIIIIIVCNSF